MKLRRTRLIIENHPRVGWFNMSADMYLMKKGLDAQFNAVVRFFCWQPPAVSLGYHQAVDVIDVGVAADLGWDVVRRPTGGRVLLHQNDLSYSVVWPIETNPFVTLKVLYNGIAESIVEALIRLGINNVNSGTLPRTVDNFRSGLCLDSRVRGEVLVDGRKIAGASQRIFKNSVLQHGSIMLSGDPSDIVKVSRLDHDSRRLLAEELRLRTCTVGDYLTNWSVEEIVEQITVTLSNKLKLECVAEGWTRQELEEIERYRAEFELVNSKSGMQKEPAVADLS